MTSDTTSCSAMWLAPASQTSLRTEAPRRARRVRLVLVAARARSCLRAQSHSHRFVITLRRS